MDKLLATCCEGVADTTCALDTTMMQKITLLIALVASDRFADVTLARTLQNCLPYISSHH